MAQIFPEWTNKLPLYLIVGVIFAVIGAISIVWYFGSPKYLDAGYRPVQPVEYSHKLHAGDLGIDCRYCHTSVEKSAVASVPPTAVCMNCHKMVQPESKKLSMVRASFNNDMPIKWVRVHKIGEYSYFNHSIHVNRGVGCISCHGNVAQMDKVTQIEPLSMGWCLDCHRNPGPNLRPVSEVTNMAWEKSTDHDLIAASVIEKNKIDPPTDCSGCHR